MEQSSKLMASPVAGSYNFKDVNFKDLRVWNLISRGMTKGLFQIESQLGTEWCKKVKPSSISELSDLISIIRPGPLESGMSESYSKRKAGKEEITYLHPALEPILKDTYGTLVYQEQALRIAVELAGFNPVEADTLRKGIGKKDAETIAKCQKLFVEKAVQFGLLNKAEAEEVFGWIHKSVRYSFNKSHSISYALMSYLCAYQKTHFPTEFYCSWLTFSNDKPEPKREIYELVMDAKLNEVNILPPSISLCNPEFKITGPRTIVFGLQHIRGIGESAAESIIVHQDIFKDWKTMLSGVRRIKKNVAESLIKAGACDEFGVDRCQMVKELYVLYGATNAEHSSIKELTDKELDFVLKRLHKDSIGNILRQLILEKACVPKRVPTIEAKIEYIEKPIKDTAKQRSIFEKIYLGLNLSCSAVDDIEADVKNAKSCRDVYFEPPGSKGTVYVVCDEIRKRKTGEKSKNPGQEYAYLCVSDNTAALQNVTIWPETYAKIKDDLYETAILKIGYLKDAWQGREQLVVRSISIVE